MRVSNRFFGGMAQLYLAQSIARESKQKIEQDFSTARQSGVGITIWQISFLYTMLPFIIKRM